MIITETMVIGTIVSAVIGVAAWYLKFIIKQNHLETKELENKVLRLEKFQVESENKFVTEERMKTSVTEALEPYKESQQEIKLLITNLTEQVTSLSKDVAVQLALGRLYGNQRDSNSSDR